MGWWVFMLEIKKIHKVYTTDNFKQTALDNVSLNFVFKSICDMLITYLLVILSK